MNKKVLIVDNYDSFTYNLAQIVNEIIQEEADVRKNDKITVDEVKEYSHIILSPGPGLPNQAGIIKSIIENLGPTHKVLGVCLGLQAIGEAYGAKLKNLQQVFHGIQSDFYKTEIESPIFENIHNPFKAGRYHSWVIDPEDLGKDLLVTSKDSNNQIMSIQHKSYHVYGVQFHPESIMTPQGPLMIQNFLEIGS